jgi:hypothetical protein
MKSTGCVFYLEGVEEFSECRKDVEIESSKITGIRAGFAVKCASLILHNRQQDTYSI